MTTATETGRLYEAMFLLSQGVAAEFTAAIDHIKELLGRANVEIVSMRKWDERRLAYEIDKQKRGVYILVYFTAVGDAPAQLERDCNMSERIMRVLVTRVDHMTLEEAQILDDQQGLEAEAKMRQDRGVKEEQKRSGVRLGRPEDEKPEGQMDDSYDAGDASDGEGDDSAERGSDEN